MTEDEKKSKYGENCPACETPWTKTPKIVCNDRWWHCVKCEKKAEDIPKKAKSVSDDSLDAWMHSGAFDNKGWF